MFPLRTTARRVLLAAALMAPVIAHGAGSEYSGRFECTQVTEGDQVVSMTLEMSVVSHREEEISGATVTLVDASDPAVVYAEFPALQLSPGVDVPLIAPVSLGRAEWDRWRSGAPPRVRLEAMAADGTDLGAMVDMVQISAPEVLQ
jgi:hypothetical protein